MNYLYQGIIYTTLVDLLEQLEKELTDYEGETNE